MHERIQDENDMALAALLDSIDRPMSPELREKAQRIAARHFAAEGSAADLLPDGAVIGSYRIERVLGVGGQAVVYLARHERLRARLVALKVPHGQTSRLLKEADAMARLDHPGVVGILDIDEQAEPPYLVLDYCAGGSLADRLEGGPLSETEVLRITSALLEGLAYAHDQGVVHRDLKPENVLFDATSNPQIADFGLGKVVAEQISLSLSQGTRTGIAGTPLYMAPEQERPGADIDGRTDLYALGKIVYRMLTGEHPSTLRPIEHSRQDLRHPWSEFVFKLTESFPDARPADARAVQAELAAWTQAEAEVQPNVFKRAETKVTAIAGNLMRDETLHSKLKTLGDKLLSKPSYALSFILGIIGALGMAAGVEAAFLPLLFGFILAIVAHEGEKEERTAAKKLERERLRAQREQHRIQAGVVPKRRRTGLQVFALIFAVLGFVLCFLGAMGGTITAIVSENRHLGLHYDQTAETAMQITFAVSGFIFLGSMFLYLVSRPAKPQALPVPPTPPTPPAVQAPLRAIVLPEPPQPPLPPLPGDDPGPRA